MVDVSPWLGPFTFSSGLLYGDTTLLLSQVPQLPSGSWRFFVELLWQTREGPSRRLEVGPVPPFTAAALGARGRITRPVHDDGMMTAGSDADD